MAYIIHIACVSHSCSAPPQKWREFPDPGSVASRIRTSWQDETTNGRGCSFGFLLEIGPSKATRPLIQYMACCISCRDILCTWLFIGNAWALGESIFDRWSLYEVQTGWRGSLRKVVAPCTPRGRKTRRVDGWFGLRKAYWHLVKYECI